MIVQPFSALQRQKAFRNLLEKNREIFLTDSTGNVLAVALTVQEAESLKNYQQEKNNEESF